MIYYPLAILLLLKIRNILIVTDPNNILILKNYLVMEKDLELKFSTKFKINQKELHALKISQKFINNKKICAILGDNIFYGQSLIENIKEGLKISLDQYFWILHEKS